MCIKENIKQLFEMTTNYKISKATGIGESTLGRYTSGGSKIGNMKLDHAITLNKYYIKLKGDIKMENLLKRYEEERHDLKDWELVESDMFVEITTQHSQSSWYGRLSVAIEKAVLEDDTVIYVVHEEENAELVKQSKDADTIYLELTKLDTTGEFDPVAAFDTLDEAKAYIAKEYDVKDLEELVNEEIYDKRVEEKMEELEEDYEGSWEMKAIDIVAVGLKEFAEELIDNDIDNIPAYILDKLHEADRVRESDYYEEDEGAAASQDGYVWLDEASVWISVD